MRQVSNFNCKRDVCLTLGVNKQVWKNGNEILVADKQGYEGLVEYLISNLLSESSLSKGEYLLYDTEIIDYRNCRTKGAKTKWPLRPDWEVISLSDLLIGEYGFSIYSLFKDKTTAFDRLESLVSIAKLTTKLNNVGLYIGKLILIDAFFLNRTRSIENLLILKHKDGYYKLCPYLNFGDSLLSDSSFNCNQATSLSEEIENAKANFLCYDFDEEVDAVEKMFGKCIRFHFDEKTIDKLLKQEKNYSWQKKARVKEILLNRMASYDRYFTKKVYSENQLVAEEPTKYNENLMREDIQISEEN